MKARDDCCWRGLDWPNSCSVSHTVCVTVTRAGPAIKARLLCEFGCVAKVQLLFLTASVLKTTGSSAANVAKCDRLTVLTGCCVYEAEHHGVQQRTWTVEC